MDGQPIPALKFHGFHESIGENDSLHPSGFSPRLHYPHKASFVPLFPTGLRSITAFPWQSFEFAVLDALTQHIISGLNFSFRAFLDAIVFKRFFFQEDQRNAYI